MNATQITLLPKVTLQMTVTCDAPVIFALKATDNRIGSGSGSGFGVMVPVTAKSVLLAASTV